MTFNFFVLPFLLGLIFLLGSVTHQFYGWITSLKEDDKQKFYRGLRSPALLRAIKEVFFESLLHRKMFRRNPLLGYMHMSFAFGWFMLIVVGNMESRIYSGLWVNPPYYPIFLKFFIHDKRVLPFEIFTVPGFFRFSMDLLLLFVLSGLVLAIIKRSRSRWFGLKKTTELHLTDKVAMACLWLIFPMRLLAESFTAGAYGYGGGFVTQHLGNLLALLWPFSDKVIAYGFWWFYSLSLGIFFVTLPYSRYKHIPTEVLLIFFRNFTISPRKEYSVFSEVEVMSCPRCGVCIDVCQMNTAADIHDAQAVYFIQSVREEHVSPELALKCLVCGRCQEVCPVGIQTDALRVIKRQELANGQQVNHTFLTNGIAKPADVLYFAGCMSHLNPGIIRSMLGIMDSARIHFHFMDKDRTICCGRPMMLAGKEQQAQAMISKNIQFIKESGAHTLVTSCPICYRVFKEDYHLNIRIQHHSSFLLDLVKTGKIPLQAYFQKVAYHDPCDLGRGTSEYDAPRDLLRKVADLTQVEEEQTDSLCCGGSLGAFTMSQDQKDRVTKQALDVLMKSNPDAIATACPLCRKTFTRLSPVKVLDIAELVYDAIPKKEPLETMVE